MIVSLKRYCALIALAVMASLVPAAHAQTWGAPAFGQVPPARGEVIGSGPVRVTLLLPLTGSAASVGQSMANGARLAMESVAATGAQNIHLVIKDTAGDPARAQTAAQEAVAEGARLILGPLRAGSVQSAGDIARAANIPLVGFSNTASAAREGVYLLSVLPEAETTRAFSFASAQGGRSVIAFIPATPYGDAQDAALRLSASEMGFEVRQVFRFSNEAEARAAVETAKPMLVSGQADTVFLPDRATAPSFGILLQAAQIPRAAIVIIGSADWNDDEAIGAQPYLAGAIHPAVDPNGLAAMAPAFSARFGSAPHPLASVSYSAVLLANNGMLASANPPYSPQLLVTPSGFVGQDGPFRFHFDGRGEYGLVIKQISDQGAQVIDPVKLGGITRQAPGAATGASSGFIPPASQFQ